MCRYRGNVFIAVLTSPMVRLEKKPWNLGFGIFDTRQIRGALITLTAICCPVVIGSVRHLQLEVASDSQHQPRPLQLISFKVLRTASLLLSQTAGNTGLNHALEKLSGISDLEEALY